MIDIDFIERNSIPVPEAGCWLWTGQQAAHGYGRLRVTPAKNGERPSFMQAHRASYEASYGPIPKGLLVCHKCDTPQCVNPAHLFTGTNADNMADRKRKGRYRGEWGGRALLTESQVLEIFHSDEMHKALASKYGIGRSTVTFIKRGLTWAYLTGGAKAATPVTTEKVKQKKTWNRQKTLMARCRVCRWHGTMGVSQKATYCRACGSKNLAFPSRQTTLERQKERFDRYVIPVPESGCHLWIGHLDKAGYGRFRVGGRSGTTKGAHRVSYVMAHGDIPNGLPVCHKCDTRCCVNPDHLFLGTSHNNDTARGAGNG